MRLIMKVRKLKFDDGLSAYRNALEMLRYAGKIRINEVKETEDLLTIEFNCYNKEWAKEFLIPRCRSRCIEIMQDKKEER